MNLCKSLKAKKILVIGDVMLDTYYSGDVNRISPEAPVPVFRKRNERSVLGGAANVAANLVAANQNVTMMTLIGRDENGERMLELFHGQGIHTELVFRGDRHTTTKTRFIASNNQQVLRLDEEDTFALSDEECSEMLAVFRAHVEEYDLIVFSDYLKGLLTYDFTQGVIQIANAQGIRVLVDVKDPKVSKYANAYLLKPNQKELHDLTGMPVETEEEIIAASQSLRKSAGCEYVLTTCGAKGMRLVGETLQASVTSVGKEVFDVTGAGDTTISYVAACLANNFDLRQSVEIANYAAGLQVGKVGTSAITIGEVNEFLMTGKQGVIHKIIDAETVRRFRADHANQTIVFTNGCFDILHVGHVRYLQEAAKLGDLLIVGLNSDASVKRLKGESRPVNTQADRAETLCALEYVDYVTIFEEDTPYDLIRTIQPDVLVKGGDYRPENVVGRDIVEARGGRLELIPFVEGKSTTKTIERMKQA